MRGVIYARYSEGPRQTDQSIEGQVADCKAYAEQHGIDVIGVYADRHISGTSIVGRDEFQRMMHDADRRRFDAVITWKIDRFGRSREDIAVNKIRLKKAGIQLMYARESVPDGPEGILLESLLEGLAEYYSADLRQKVTRGIRESAKKGRLTGRLPIGYVRTKDKKVVIDEQKAEAIREIFRMQLAGATTLEMQQSLMRHGIVAKDGGAPVKAVVYRMLRNPHYLGRFEVQGVEVQIDPIIDKETFDAVAQSFKGSLQNAAGRAQVDYILSCKCHCEICGKLLNGTYGTGKLGQKYYYYRCFGKNCKLKPVHKDRLEELVLEHTMQDVLTEEMIDKLTKRIMEIQEAEHSEDPAVLLKTQLKEAKKKQKNLIDAIEAGAGVSLVSRLNEVDTLIGDLQLEIEKAELRRPIIPEEYVRSWLMSFKGGDVSDPVFRKKLVDTFVADVIVGPEQVTVCYNTTLKKPYTVDSVRVRLCSCAFRDSNPGHPD